MSRWSPLLAFDAAAAGVASLGWAMAFRPERLLRRAPSPPAAQALRIAGTMVMALGLAAILFATTFRLSAS